MRRLPNNQPIIAAAAAAAASTNTSGRTRMGGRCGGGGHRRRITTGGDTMILESSSLTCEPVASDLSEDDNEQYYDHQCATSSSYRSQDSYTSSTSSNSTRRKGQRTTQRRRPSWTNNNMIAPVLSILILLSMAWMHPMFFSFQMESYFMSSVLRKNNHSRHMMMSTPAAAGATTTAGTTAGIDNGDAVITTSNHHVNTTNIGTAFIETTTRSDTNDIIDTTAVVEDEGTDAMVESDSSSLVVETDGNMNVQKSVVATTTNFVPTTNKDLNVDDDYPDETQRALFVISMGKNAAKSNIVERFVYSVRTRGKFQGWIVVLSDAPQSRYHKLTKNHWTSNVLHMQPNPLHLQPAGHNFSMTTMGYKRLKTYVLEYVGMDSRLNDVHLVEYLDVDIVVGDSLWPMFHGLERTYGIANGTSPVSQSLSTSPQGKVWMFQGNTAKWRIQGGQMFLHRTESQPCLERWRYLMDTASKYSRKDQDMLMQMLQEQEAALDNEDLSHLACEVIIMKQKPFIEFPKPNAIVSRAKKLRANTNTNTNSTNKVYHYAPLVHLRNDGGTKRVQSGHIKVYIQDVLKFEPGQEDTLGVLEKMVM